MLSVKPCLLGLCVLLCSQTLRSEDRFVHEFERIQLTNEYYSEGANVGDFNRDGHPDVVHGPHWYEGPDFQKSHTIYPPRPQPRERYADNFFSWAADFSRDGWADVLVVGFPGTPAYVYVNPGESDRTKWERHQVFDWVSNESPHFTNLVGDDRPELVCTRDGRFGYASIDWSDPLQPWVFHAISGDVTAKRFGHGLGVGDINGDGRLDVLQKDGWFEQPAELDGDPLWKFHAQQFARAGGAEMYAYDVDGDGDNDVITSLSAHNYGLAWYEQTQQGDQRMFTQHLIMGDKPEDNEYGIVFTEPHSVALADVDGDGLKDIVTGKTYWSHHRQSPLWDAGAVVYWFRLVRAEDGVHWVPYLADGESGIGRQLIVTDVDRDEIPDIVVGGMKGSHVLRHRRRKVTEAEWLRHQPRKPRALTQDLSGPEAAEAMTVPAGFRVQLAAAEPDVHQPIAMTIDDRGRVWVAEAYTYPVRAAEGQGLDKIIILEDTDQDGTLDHRKVFAEGLNLVSGLEVGFGGVWVGAAPYLMFIPDQNRDDRPDGPPQILLDGFGYEDTHETLNAFNWGPDGWLYGCHGVFTHSRVGKPGTPDDQRVGLNAGVWRYHPVRHEFEVFAWGTSNPWGVDFNDHGQAFITACVIPHLWHMIQGARYQRQGGRHFNPYVYEDIQTIAKHRHYVGNIRDHAWWGNEPETPQSTLAAGGGHAHCGAMIYLGDNWPAAYRDQLFMNNVHGNRVNCDRLARSGSGYAGDRAPDLLLANDRWFRGINLRYGPDGTVYLIDWYDRNACHRRNPEIWDRTNGRIYRVVYGQPETRRVNLDAATTEELITLQAHPNDWFVRVARRILQHRAAQGKITESHHTQLWKQFSEQQQVPRKLRALWALHVTGGLNESRLRELLSHESEYVRAWSIQLAHDDHRVEDATLEAWAGLAASDESQLVRLYLAAAMGRTDVSKRPSVLVPLMQHEQDADDHNLPLMYWYAIEPWVDQDPLATLELLSRIPIPTVQRLIIRRAAIKPEGLRELVTRVASAKDRAHQHLILDEMLKSFAGRVSVPMPKSWNAAYDQLLETSDDALQDKADQLAVIFGDQRIFPRLRSVLVDEQQALSKRRQALEILVRGRDAGAAESLQAVLEVPQLRASAIRALAAFDDPSTPKAILAQYPQLDDEERRDAINTLVARPSFARRLLEAIQRGQVPRTDLHAYNVRQLLRFDDAALEQQIKEVWGEFRRTSEQKQAEIAALKRQLTPRALRAGDLSNGRLLFSKTCANCHTLFGAGGKIGPDLTGSNRTNLDYILENILDPSAVLGKDYRLTVVATESGRVISGLLEDENDNAITLRTLNERVVIAKDEIEVRKLSDQSMMPERILESLKPLEVRDLIAYLASTSQVPLRGPRAPIDSETGTVAGAQEAEQLKIVGKTAGQARSQPMGSFSKDRWSGDDQLWWTGAKPGDQLELAVNVEAAGEYQVEVVLTRARDYGIVKMSIASQPLGGPVDLYNSPDVLTTGVLSFEGIKLEAGEQRIRFEIVGAHPQAVKQYMVGIDYVRLIRQAASERAASQ